jgi:hypothetical protein
MWEWIPEASPIPARKARVKETIRPDKDREKMANLEVPSG